MKELTPLEKAQAKLRRAQSIFWTGEEPLRVHQIRIEVAQAEVNYYESK
ncbi:hypothetical protein [Vibrio phage vB_VpaP_SJSY21]|nr:hypothetical protein [Vibrio phage vB_VpaP_SJSY21]